MCVREDRVWDRVSLCTCGQSVLLCVSVCTWIEFRIV